MQRLLIVFLILQCAAAASEDPEGNPSGDYEDDEDLSERSNFISNTDLQSFGTDESKGGENDDKADGTLIIIIAATSVIALAVVAIVATVLFRRYSQTREQGVYSMPAEQGQKVVV